MTPCKFRFDDSPVFEGWTDGTFWNGFANVWVAPDVRELIAQHFRNAEGDAYDDQIERLPLDRNGRVSLAMGYATSLVDGLTLLGRALAADDVDDACRLLQDALGITDGGIAGQCMGSLDDGEWKNASKASRSGWLSAWLRAELFSEVT